MAIISFRDFSFQYRAQKNPTLYHINLDIQEGEKVLIVGASGSGKSTLAHCINGLVPSSYPGTCTGSLQVDGLNAPSAGVFALSQHVGTVLQDPDGQFIGLTVGEDIAFSLENDCVPQEEMKVRVAHAAQLVQVGSLLGQAPHEISGGQKQRVSLAGVMVGDVKILLFDEPLANLDPAAGKQAIELIDAIHQRQHTTVVIIEHRLEDALWRNVDRIILLHEGRIVADCTPQELFTGSLLHTYGIREPLYLSALRYAGVQIRPEHHPENIHALRLDEDEKAQVRRWFAQEIPPKDHVPQPVLLEASGLGFGYTPDVQTLKDISFQIRQGEMVSIVGRNGAGKSTLSKLICGFETQWQGSVYLHGECLDTDTIRKRACHIGYVMQDPNQMISKTMIFDEVALGLKGNGMGADEVRSRVEKTLQICGLYPFRNWPISALSFGQKKRVTIASVLVMEPEVIILDEPTAGQDFRHYTEIMEFLRGLNAHGVTVLMITHDMHLMLEYTSRALVFNQGKLEADVTSAQALCNPALVERAALKETSLFSLAQMCRIDAPVAFVDHFIRYDREVRSGWQPKQS